MAKRVRKAKRGPESVSGGAPVGAEGGSGDWSPPEYSGDPTLTRGPMRTGTPADFDSDLDDGHNMQSAIHGHPNHGGRRRRRE